MSESKEQKRLRALQGDIDRAARRLEACRTRREQLTRARESAFAAENLAATHRHIEKLKALFAEERAASQAYTNAIDALSGALDEIEHQAPARQRRK